MQRSSLYAERSDAYGYDRVCQDTKVDGVAGGFRWKLVQEV